MPLSHLEHFLIQTADMKKTRDWYVEVLGMREGHSPDFKFPVCWLYIGERDVLHIAEGGKNVSSNRMQYLGQQSDATEGSGVIDHVAFRASGLRDMLVHLQRMKVDFKTRRVNTLLMFELVEPEEQLSNVRADDGRCLAVDQNVCIEEHLHRLALLLDRQCQDCTPFYPKQSISEVS